MAERKHIITDILFRHSYTASNNINEEFEEDINNFLKVKLNVIRVAFIQIRSKSSAD